MLHSIHDLPNAARTARFFWRKVNTSSEDGCWPWLGERDTEGYGRVSITINGNRKRYRAHRIAYLLTFESLPGPPLIVRHYVCGNPACCRPDHLRIGTNQDNMTDGKRLGEFACGTNHPWNKRPELVKRGEDVHLHKVDEADVRDIRALWLSGLSQSELARRYGLSQAAVWAIVRRKSWTHVL